MSVRRVVHVPAHKACEDELLYRVQWSTRECEWASGPSLDLPETSPSLLGYWQTGVREVADKSTQSHPCGFFEFPATARRAFAEGATAPSSAPAAPAAPAALKALEALEVRGGRATVRFCGDPEPAEMDLAQLRVIAPRVVAEFFMAQQG
jgi:hypothetical protein